MEQKKALDAANFLGVKVLTPLQEEVVVGGGHHHTDEGRHHSHHDTCLEEAQQDV